MLGEDGEDGGPGLYERQRNERIKRNEDEARRLGLLPAITQDRAAPAAAKRAVRKEPRKEDGTERRSSRNSGR